ncbi:MAG: hypothetical protein ACHQJD_01730 [Thermoanaerobaculia bacterium]
MKRLVSILAGGLTLVTAIPASAASDRIASSTNPPMITWQAPASYTQAARGPGRTALFDLTTPLPFIPLLPCRQYDSRSHIPLADNTGQDVLLTGAPCGIPAGTAAVALNITIFNITGAGSNGVFKVGIDLPPTTAWINYPPTETQRGNAGVLPLNQTGILAVMLNQGAGSVDFVVDVYGYYGSGSDSQSPFTYKVNSLGPAVYVANTNTSCNGGCGLSATAYNGYGVYGVSTGNGNLSAGVAGYATNTSGSLEFGVLGTAGQAGNYAGGSAGVHGETELLNVYGYGVLGTSGSPQNGSAGVMGVDGANSAMPSPVLTYFTPSGVVGLGQYFGVQGGSFGKGVAGTAFDGTGAVLAEGDLGYNTIGTPAVYGVYSFGNTGATGIKAFVEPHATDASKVIRYVSQEGPEAGTYFRGTSQTRNGAAAIPVPESFRMVTDDAGLTVQVTATGRTRIWVESEDLNEIVVRSDEDVRFHYLVQGIRRAFRDFEAIGPGSEFMPRSPNETIPLYLTEEAKSRLISNGTYNPDGTVNMATAERLGWAKAWREKAAAAAAARK